MSERIGLLPLPESVDYRGGRLGVSGSIAVLDETGDKPFAVEYARSRLGARGPAGMNDAPAAKTSDSVSATSVQRPVRLRFSRHSGDPRGQSTSGDAPTEGGRGEVLPAEDESYRVDIGPSGIRVDAESDVGLFYGACTVCDLVEAARLEAATSGSRSPAHARATVPCCVISDRPCFSYRGFMLDSVRHFLPVEFLKWFIDAMASLKLNVFHWHLSDDQGFRLELDSRPALTTIGAFVDSDPDVQGFYRKDQVRDILEYAGRRGVTVIPEIDMPGHAFAIVSSYPDLSCTGAPQRNPGHQKDLLCAGNPDTYRFLEELIAEMSDLFPGELIHLGGDEAPKDRWKECPSCQARISREGLSDEDALQSALFRDAVDIAARYGKQVVGWEEVLSPGGALPVDVVVQWWRHRTHRHAAAARGVQAGHRVIASPNSFCYLSFPTVPDEHFKPERTSTLETVYTASLLPDGLHRGSFPARSGGGVVGGEFCVWTEYLTHRTIPAMVFPRAFAVAELLWRYPVERDIQDLKRRIESACHRFDVRPR